LNQNHKKNPSKEEETKIFGLYFICVWKHFLLLLSEIKNIINLEIKKNFIRNKKYYKFRKK